MATGQILRRRYGAAGWIAASVAAAVLLALAGVVLSGAAQERVLGDPGAMARWGLPAVLAVHHLALAAVVGSLIFAAVIVPRKAHTVRQSLPGPGGRSAEDDHPAFVRSLTVASVSAVVWVPAAAAVLLLTYADIAGSPLSADPGFTNQLGLFVTDIAAGRARLAILLIALLVSMLVFVIRSSLGLLMIAGLALVSIVPATAAIGHAAGSTDHIGASNALGLHVAAATVWAGGIIVLAAIIPALTLNAVPQSVDHGTRSGDTATVLRRFSSLAGLTFALVVATGTVSSLYRLDETGDLLSPYGALLLSKTAATLLLGLLGLLHRRRIIPQLDGPTSRPRLLWQVLIVELLLMGAAAGLAIALSRSPSPVPQEPDPDATPAQLLTGYLLPPAPDSSTWLLQWRPDWLWIAISVLAGLAYVRVYGSARRKDPTWAKLPLLSWFSALILLTFVTSGPPAVYGPVMLSAHAAGMVTLVLAIPVLLLAGKPLHLLLHVVPDRTDASIGPKEIVLTIAHAASKPGPLVFGPVLGSLVILFYLTPAFTLSLSEHLAHETVLILFLTLGLLLANTVYGRTSPECRGPRVIGVGAALAGIAAVGSRFLQPAGIEQDWFAGLGRAWGPFINADQLNAGIILLSACALAAGIFIASQLRRTQIQCAHSPFRQHPGNTDHAPLHATERPVMNKKTKQQRRSRRNQPRPDPDRQARLTTVQSQQRSTERKRNTLIFGGIGAAVTAIIIAVTIVIVGQVRQNNDLNDLASGNIEGVQTIEDLTNNHIEGTVEYAQSPPVGGDHNPIWTNCGVYTEPLPDTNTVHSLEHGAAWITYQPELDQKAINELADLVGTRGHILLSPYPGQDAPIKASAWGVQLSVDSAEDERLAAFLQKYVQGEQTPEPGATCSGGIDPS